MNSFHFFPFRYQKLRLGCQGRARRYFSLPSRVPGSPQTYLARLPDREADLSARSAINPAALDRKLGQACSHSNPQLLGFLLLLGVIRLNCIYLTRDARLSIFRLALRLSNSFLVHLLDDCASRD